MLDYSHSDMLKQQQEFKTQFTAVLKKSKRTKRPRALSDHVGSRWYRAPEIILMEKSYDQGVDLWSVGCVLDEMIYCSEPYIKKLQKKEIGLYLKQKASFKGTSCFPLSPCNIKKSENETFDIEETDQLVKINEKICVTD